MINIKRMGKTVAVPILMVLLAVNISFADVVSMESSLIWRKDNLGDYSIPRPSTSGEYLLGEFIATKGQAQKICVNYSATGAALVEVSADNGLHYYPVVNGVPLEKDFISGNRIKWRAQMLKEGAQLNYLKIDYADSSGVVTDFGSPQLSGFNYRRELFLSNPAKEPLYNYQVKLKIAQNKNKEADADCQGRVKEDFSDIRFTAADAKTPLPYYLESLTGAHPDLIAHLWVNVPEIPKEGVRIYIYYGANQAQDNSQPTQVFDFYDDFKDVDVSSANWIVQSRPNGTCLIEGGRLCLDASELISKDFIFNEGIIEYGLLVDTGIENSLTLRPKSNDSFESPSFSAYSSAYKGAEHCVAIYDIVKANDGKAKPIGPSGSYNYRIRINEDNVLFERFGSAASELQASVEYSHESAIKPGHIGLKSGGDGGGRNKIIYSFVRARKYALKEPMIASAGNEELVNLPYFSNTLISPKGNLLLDLPQKEGVYISRVIPADFSCRIIVPSFKGVNVNVAVSADRGLHYREDCVSGNYYYASIKDFTEGKDILARAKISPSKNRNVISELESLQLEYNPGTILVVKPNGGEEIPSGSSYDIYWSALGYDSRYPLKLEYSLDKGKAYSQIADKVNNSGSYSWQVPKEINSKEVLIRVSDSNDLQVNDLSDSVFSISESLLGAEKSAEDSAEQTGESIKQAGEDAKDQLETAKQSRLDLNDLNQDYVIDKEVTISTKADIAFKSLILGDGTGKAVSRIILNHNINPASGSIIIRRGGELIQANADNQSISGDLIVQERGVITHLANKTDKKYEVNLSARNIVLNPGSIVSAYAKGYSGGEARKPGLGRMAGVYIGKRAGGAKAGAANDSGSGGAGSWSAKGGAGGGIIRLSARNEFSISGIINADGQAGEASRDNTYDGAGGAGGSIYLSAQKFSGSGSKITATGGAGSKTGGAGAGGNINTYSQSGAISGSINANYGKGFREPVASEN